MHGRRRSALLMLAATMILTGSLSSPAAAASRVVRETGHISGQAVLADCGSFSVLDDFSFDFSFRLISDKNGDPVQVIEQIRGTDTLINSETEKSITGSFANNEHIDLTTDPVTARVTGVIFKIVVPGVGAVLIDVGRLVFQDELEFIAGRRDVSDGNLDALCQALA